MDEVEFYLMDLASRFPKDRENYYLSYSGGRDSHFLYWFIKEYLHDDKIEIVGINTYMEHPQIMKRMRQNCDTILYPKMKPFEIKEKYGSPCFSKMQDEIISRWQNGCRTDYIKKWIYGGNEMANGWTKFRLNKTAKELLLSGKLHRVSNKCCDMLKKKTGKDFQKKSGKKPILAVRGAESALRKAQYKRCFDKKGTFHPLYDLSDELLAKIEKRYNIEVPEIYNHISRTGCMGCPYGHSKGGTERELRLVNKSQRRFLSMYFKESYEVLGIDIRAIQEECGDFDTENKED